ncbi:MAG TPA: hypothetical protein VKF84_13185 [Candidatus Sulfotelmatobacter sp.]|nr:hypothetical protein [Candidatus Sulfotelmatobacter sp.]
MTRDPEPGTVQPGEPAPRSLDPNIDNSAIRQANYRIRWESSLASACCGRQAGMAVQAV